jgi:hypothetical protein
MKRSEMIKIIAQDLSENYPPSCDHKIMAECILSKLENAGMLPPPIRYTDYPYFSGDHPEGYFPEVNVWQEELEKWKPK